MITTTCDFDTHSFIKKLIKSNIPKPQAEAIIEVLHDIKQVTGTSIVTKEDMYKITKTIQKEIEILKQEIQKLELRMTIRLGTMMACLTSIIITIFKII